MNTPSRHGILAIGNLLVDHTRTVAAYPQESMLATIEHMARHCGGCTNVLFNLARLAPRLPRYLAGATGDDDDGRFIREQAARRGINCDAVLTLAAPTSFTDVVISRANGSRTFFHHLGAMAEYGAAHITALDCPAKIAHIAYPPLLPALLPDLAAALDALRANGFLVSLDLVSLPDAALFAALRPALAHSDYLIINDVEAALLLDCAPDTNLSDMADRLLALGVRDSVILHAAHSAAACNHRGERAELPVYALAAHEMVSTLGAGDAFCTAALYALHEGMALIDVLRLGHAFARFNLQSLSATDGAVSLDTLMQFIGETRL